MSSEQQPDYNAIAKAAEQDLNSYQAKQGHDVGKGDFIRPSDSTGESGVNENVEAKFPGSTVNIGGQGASDNIELPADQGGYLDKETGKWTKQGDFEGVGGPEDKRQAADTFRPGDADTGGNVRNN